MRQKYLLFLLWIKKEARSKNFLTDNAVDKTYCPLLPNFLSLISGTFPKPTALFIKSKIHNFLLLLVLYTNLYVLCIKKQLKFIKIVL